MIINKIKEALKPLNIKSYNITRGNQPIPCLVYSYTGKPKASSDNEIDSMEYTILINILINEDIEKTKKELIAQMKANNFKLREVKPTQFIELGGFYNTPVVFKIYL